jgi:putative transposase
MRSRGYRVESVCRVLCEHGVQVAPRTCRNWKTAAPSARTVTDAALTDALRATVGTPEGMYGRRKMTAYLRRRGHRVARCTVDRLMRDEGLSGVVRGRRHRTTIPGKDARRAPDLLDRDFTAAAPNRKWVTDFTYTRTWSGFVYVAFVVDCYSRAIVGWHAATVKDTAMVTTALKMALWRRDHANRSVVSGLIHHSDAGSQAGFNWSSQHLDYLEVWGGVREAAVGGSCVSGADALAGATDGGLAGGQSPVLEGDRCRGDDRGRRGPNGRVLAGWVPLVPPCWRRESTIAGDGFGPLSVLE